MTYLNNTGLTQLIQLIHAKFAPQESPEFTGIPTTPEPDIDDESNQIATTAFVKTSVSNLYLDSIPSTEVTQHWNSDCFVTLKASSVPNGYTVSISFGDVVGTFNENQDVIISVPIGTAYNYTLPSVSDYTVTPRRLQGTIIEDTELSFVYTRDEGEQIYLFRYTNGGAAATTYTLTITNYETGAVTTTRGSGTQANIIGTIGSHYHLQIDPIPGYTTASQSREGDIISGTHTATILFTQVPDPTIIDDSDTPLG